MRWTIDHTARDPLQQQIAGCIRRGIASGELAIGEQLPPAAELGLAMSVDRNTVLAAYRQLREEGVLEFRRGRGARVAAAGPDLSTVIETARTFVETARAHGLGRPELIRIIEELT